MPKLIITELNNKTGTSILDGSDAYISYGSTDVDNPDEPDGKIYGVFNPLYSINTIDLQMEERIREHLIAIEKIINRQT